MIKSGLTIVADENMPALEPLFGHLGSLVRLPGRSMTPDDLKQADILLVRSVTQVGEALLRDSQVKFVGTATIGTDHIDQAWLQQAGIAFASAPGCNADAVVDYVLSVCFHLAREQTFDLRDRTFGVVGEGNVGGRLVQRLRAMGVQVLVCDPPKAREQAVDVVVESTVNSSLDSVERVDLPTLLAQADIISLHTPLTHDGEDPTWHLLGADQLAVLRTGTILINTARGPIIDNQALLQVARQRCDLTLILDVWEQEPVVDPELAALCRIATPHIAGYSLDGKIRGSWMLYQALGQWLEREPEITLQSVLPPAAFNQVVLGQGADTLPLMQLLYDPHRDDRALRATLHLRPDERVKAFDHLRKSYPERREFATLSLSGDISSAQRRELSAVGFRL
ncbi:4-phosphoerythronate dehydrogenase PdxB [Nitrincola alkalilacustris]|uniref:4-phosphoerythronate dehydrogenase PdxB n=1 Tax=Nitrincola alkalilacustris TaxID=1571224 RepID=UPI001F0E2A9F|nr:4-phosphoerythronate dehydrogenase PdxB [Nitrincola alkalilacustris]